MSKTAIDAPRGTIFMMDPDDLVIVTDPNDPLYDRRGLEPPDPALVASIRLYGVDKAVKAWKDGERVLVIDGRRRVLAAREAKRLSLECGGPVPKVKLELHRGDQRSAVMRMVLGNFSPKEEGLLAKAQKAASLVAMNYSDEEIGIAFAVSAATIRNWVSIAALSEVAKGAVEKGALRLTDAVKLGRLSLEEQPAALAELERGRPTRAAVKASGEKYERRVTPVSRLRRLERFVDQAPGTLATEVVLLMSWLRGEADDRQLANVYPALGQMFAGAQAPHAPTEDGQEAA